MRIVIEYQGKTYEGECSPLEKPDKYAYEGATLVAHYAGELKRLQEHNAALVVSLDEFFYRVRTVVQFDDAEWVCDIGAEILKQLKEGPCQTG